MFEYFYYTFRENHTSDFGFNFGQVQFDLDFSSSLICVIYCLLFVIGVPANSAIIYVYVMSKAPIKYTKLFFINLSLSDIFVLLFCIPISINDVLYPNEWFFGKTYCKCFFLII